MTPAYYNTNKTDNQQVKSFSSKAKSQEHIIYKLFVTANQPISPSNIFKSLNFIWPITSIRRAITNLATENKIIKTSDTVKGMYGKKEHLWSLPLQHHDTSIHQLSEN